MPSRQPTRAPRGVRRRAAPAVTALLVAAAMALAGCQPTPAPKPTRTLVRNTGALSIGAFQVVTSPTSLIGASAGLDTVIVHGVTLTADGSSIGAPGAAAAAQLKAAHTQGLRAMIDVTNVTPGVGFDRSLFERTAQSAANRASVAAAMAALVHRGGWDGVVFDFEELGSADGDGLAELARATRYDLGRSGELEVTVMPSTSTAGYLSRGYELAPLAAAADRLILMAYDEHGTWDPNDPGPVGAIDWQRACLEAAYDAIDPADIVLGVPGYGYVFNAEGTKAGVVSDNRARRLVGQAGQSPVWDPSIDEWTATLPDGSQLWWQDLRSLTARIALAKQQGLAGVDVWSLAVSDPIPADPAHAKPISTYAPASG